MSEKLETLTEFRDRMELAVAEFFRVYYDQRRLHPKEWPDEMLAGEWDEQFRIWYDGWDPE